MGQLISSDKIRDHYNQTMKTVEDYIEYRWMNSPIKRVHYRQTERSLTNAFGSVKSFGNTLEIGCGPAVWTRLFIDKAVSLTLLDISEEMLSRAKALLSRYDHVRYLCNDFVRAPFEIMEKLDTIVSIRAFEYMSDKAIVIKRCHELLNPGGRLMIVTKNGGWIDNRKEKKAIENMDPREIPIQKAMQMDLVSWPQLVRIYRDAGFRNIAAYPVIFGSYHSPFSTKPGLALCSLLHSYFYRSPIAPWYDTLVESYLITGEK